MQYGEMQSVTVVDGHCLQYIVTRIHHDARRPSRTGQRQDRLAMYLACTLRTSKMICEVRGRVCDARFFTMSCQFVNNLWHARSQARRIDGHALGAKYTACFMIPGNGVYRIRRRRFAHERSVSTSGGSGNGASTTRGLRQCTLQRPLDEHRISLNLLHAVYLSLHRSAQLNA